MYIYDISYFLSEIPGGVMRTKNRYSLKVVSSVFLSHFTGNHVLKIEFNRPVNFNLMNRGSLELGRV